MFFDLADLQKAPMAVDAIFVIEREISGACINIAELLVQPHSTG